MPVQTKLVLSNDDQRRVYLNYRFHAPGAGSLVPRCGHLSHIVKMHYFFKIFFSTFEDNLRQTQKDSFDDVHQQVIMQLSSVIVDFYLFYAGATDM